MFEFFLIICCLFISLHDILHYSLFNKIDDSFWKCFWHDSDIDVDVAEKIDETDEQTFADFFLILNVIFNVEFRKFESFAVVNEVKIKNRNSLMIQISEIWSTKLCCETKFAMLDSTVCYKLWLRHVRKHTLIDMIKSRIV